MNALEEARAWLHGELDRDPRELVKRLVAGRDRPAVKLDSPSEPPSGGERSPLTDAIIANTQPCNPHPDAPHGFDRTSSHSLGRYVCDCEGWEPDDPSPAEQGAREDAHSGCGHTHAEHANERQGCINAPLAAPPVDASCTCPSGDGSMRWPCPKHPPTSIAEIIADWPADEAPLATGRAGVAVDDAMVERALAAFNANAAGIDLNQPGDPTARETYFHKLMRAALEAALAGPVVYAAPTPLPEAVRELVVHHGDETHVRVLRGTYETDGICDGCGEETAACNFRHSACHKRAEVAALRATTGDPRRCLANMGLSTLGDDQ